MSAPLQVFLGYDPREHAAYEVADFSIRRRASVPVLITPLVLAHLGHVICRPVERRDGRLWCPISEAPMSTEFAISRFCVPFLQRDGWALFADCDVLCLADIAGLFSLADPRYAVQVVKHSEQVRAWCLPQPMRDNFYLRKDGVTYFADKEDGAFWRRVDERPEDDPNCEELPPAEAAALCARFVKEHQARKMDGQLQTAYPRKQWSSVVLWNCSHPAHARLTHDRLNHWPGRDLHAFKWLEDEEIGALPQEWNWLVGITQGDASNARLLHFTLGSPAFPEWCGGPCDDLWIRERCAMLKR